MDTPKSSYFVVLFDSPGPSDLQAEIQNLIPYLQQANNLRLAKGFKMKILLESVSNATDFKKLDETMKAWLESEDKTLLVRFKQVGINAHGNQYRFFQAGWTIALNENAEAVETATAVEIQSITGAAVLEYETAKVHNSTGFLGGVLDKLFKRKSEDNMTNLTKWHNGPECGNCGQTTLLISVAQVSKILMDGGVSDEDRLLAPETAYRCKECQQVSCLQCTFNTGKSLNLMVPACPKCHSTRITTIS